MRSALALAAIARRPVELERVRAGREQPGLAAQHLTAVRALAELSAAELSGAELGSQRLRFAPTRAVAPGDYAFDVAEARPGGSAGSAPLVLQTVLLPLALVPGESSVRISGGTHMRWSPPFDYVEHVWLHALGRLGVEAEVELRSYGWFPAGGGELRARVRGRADAPEPLDLVERGELRRVLGRAVAASLPSHIPQRMAARATALLARAGLPCRIEPLRVRARSPGAGLFLVAEYARVRAGFSALGERGLASEAVAEDAVGQLLEHHASGAALDPHLTDQILLPLALARGASRFTARAPSRHATTHAWLVERFGLAAVRFAPAAGGLVHVEVEPRRSPASAAAGSG